MVPPLPDYVPDILQSGVSGYDDDPVAFQYHVIASRKYYLTASVDAGDQQVILQLKFLERHTDNGRIS